MTMIRLIKNTWSMLTMGNVKVKSCNFGQISGGRETLAVEIKKARKNSLRSLNTRALSAGAARTRLQTQRTVALSCKIRG